MKNAIITLIAALLMAGAAQAVTLSTFTFTDGEFDGTDEYTVTSELYAGSTGNATFLDNAWSDGTDSVFTTENPTSTGVADNPIGFTYTVTGLAANERLTLNFLSIDYVESEFQDDGTSQGDNSVRFASLFGIGGDLNTVTFQNVTGSIDPASAGTYNTVFSAGTGYTNLQNGDVVSLAFSLRDGTSGPENVFFDNLTLDGSVSVVPEPSSYALLAGLLGLSSVMLRRRQA